jgi:hypothetical protein
MRNLIAAVVDLLRRGRGRSTPSGSPSTVGAARPGEPGGPKSATARSKLAGR